jgi:hypothetical protein
VEVLVRHVVIGRETEIFRLWVGYHQLFLARTMSQSVSLSFGGGGAKNAWDDRELVNAYDAAMDEFHVSQCSPLKLILQAHHPGPGSWLDKAMAAQAAGRPLAGASDHGTA